jgi:hypothetical protein
MLKMKTVESDGRYRVEPGTVLKADQFNNAYLVIPFRKYPEHLWGIVKPGSMSEGMRVKAIMHILTNCRRYLGGWTSPDRTLVGEGEGTG